MEFLSLSGAVRSEGSVYRGGENMRRAWKIYRILAVQNLKRLMEYKADFLTGAVSFLINQAIGIAFIFIIFSQIPQLAGFTMAQIVFIYGFSQIPKGIDHLLADNLWCVGYFIVRKGDFDKYLTRPINPLFHVIAETFQVDAIGELVVGIGLIIYSAPQAGLYITPWSVPLIILAVPFAALIYTSLKIITASFAFWIKSSGFIIQMVYGMNEFSKYPTTIYSIPVRILVTYIIPFAFTGYFTAMYIMTGENPWFNIGGVIAVSAVMFIISILIWNKGIRSYESAGA